MSNLIEHAKRELKLAGMFDKGADYGGMLAPHILHLVKEFAKEDHSGMSAQITIQVLVKLLNFKPLSPLTSNPDEWQKTERFNADVLQNKRCSSVFSKDGGKTWYDVDKQKHYGAGNQDS